MSGSQVDRAAFLAIGGGAAVAAMAPGMAQADTATPGPGMPAMPMMNMRVDYMTMYLTTNPATNRIDDESTGRLNSYTNSGWHVSAMSPDAVEYISKENALRTSRVMSYLVVLMRPKPNGM